jgi:hypothetical protein
MSTPTAEKVSIYTKNRPKNTIRSFIITKIITIRGPKISVSDNIERRRSQRNSAAKASKKSKLNDSLRISSRIAFKNF